ncbi:hypothetical protein [Methylocapsa aurea]|jgi:hypothetical protein|uniref:hypothetical protein n=1 Tax=Methylocapsa aurea TaxID=663610 RepID=UPI003D1889C5
MYEAVVTGCLLIFVDPAFASSHNEVTGWAEFFGPHPLDRGGDIPSYMNAVAAANKSGSLVVIEGTCASACTIKLGAKYRCVRPNAILWFHAAVEGSIISTMGNSLLLDTYPPRVREEVLRRHMLDELALNPEHTLTGDELIGLGERACR